MFLLTDLDYHVFEIPYQSGFRRIRILSGYASSAFLMHILTNYPDLEIELIIGMARTGGINRWDHIRYQEIAYSNQMITISYQRETPGIHTKIYHWDDPFGGNSITFIGSANFSWNGFRDQNELLAQVDYPNIEDVFDVAETIDCRDSNVENYIRFFSLRGRRVITALTGPQTSRVQLEMEIPNGEDVDTITLNDLDFVDLPLLTNNDTSIQETAGLNWGQRPGRNTNEAYIPVSTTFNRHNPNFFPPLEQAFTILTDDGEQLICKMAQQNRKAIQTTENNSIMGRYFRERLGVAYGARVDVQDVLNYSRTSVRIYKIDSETYFMDYGIAGSALTEVW
ncbi:restriction endonuclease PLD domain-containing protein [Sporosarcina koreensis]|uniref:Restriction endonuclease PLD domain-containing protein n=1 Tax=Sporosarcina koreensis TaxID=334735 RepID=A0ABW0TTU2_9BACL